MNIKTIYIIGGIVFLFLSLIGLRFKIDSYKTQIYGDFITVKVTYVPQCNFASDVYYNFKFQYLHNGKMEEYSKDIGGALCDELIVGQKLILKADLNKKIFLYEHEDVRIEFFSMAIMGFFGIILLVLGLKSKTLQ